MTLVYTTAMVVFSLLGARAMHWIVTGQSEILLIDFLYFFIALNAVVFSAIELVYPAALELKDLLP